MSVLPRKDGLQKIWQSLWLGWFFCPFPVLQAWIRLRAFTYLYQFRFQKHIQTFLRETWPYSEFFWSVMIQCSNLNDEIWFLSSTSSVTICVNHTLIIEKFPITLKNANVTPVHKNDDLTDKTNFRPVDVLPLSKLFERIIHNQLGKYMDKFLNKLLRGLGKSTLLSMPSLSSCNDGRRNLITLGCWAQYWLTFQKHMAVYLVTLLLLNSRPTV